MLLALCIVAQEVFLTSQRLHPLFQVAAPPLIFIEWEDGAQIRIGEPLDLPRKMRLGPAQCLATGEQFLRQPGPAMRPRYGFSQRLGGAQQGA